MLKLMYMFFMQSDNDEFREMPEGEPHLPSKVKFRDSVKKLKQKSAVSTNSFISITNINWI